MAAAGDKAIKTVLRRNLWAALGRGDHAEAWSIFERLQREDPLSVETRCLELELRAADGSLADAERLAAQLVVQFPGSARIQFFAGKVACLRKDYPVAIERLRESVAIHPARESRKWLATALTNGGSLDEAERLLLALVEEDSRLQLELAWVYERKGDVGRALALTEAHVQRFPKDRRAQAELVRRRAESAEPSEVIDEVEGLLGLGEPVSSELVAQYIEALLRSARGPEARRFVRERLDRSTVQPRHLRKAAWVCHRLQAYDLAVDLFLEVLPHHLGDFRFYGALERAAREAARLEELIAAYAQYAPQARELHGRIKTLRKRL